MDPLQFLAPQSGPRLQNVTVSYDELLSHPEKYYQSADIVWVMVSAAFVFLMVPSLSLIYAGIGNRTFALTMFRLPMITCALIGFEWVLWGYCLAFTKSNLDPSWWGGELRAAGLADVVARPVPTGDQIDGPAIPELAYVLYEGMFASFTAALVCGGTMHKVPPARFLIFITFWSILVYIPVARWSWDRDGWSSLRGTMDFAGGTPVHIVSGTTVAAFAVFYAIEIRTNTQEFCSALRAFAIRLLRRYTVDIVHDVVRWYYIVKCNFVIYVRRRHPLRADEAKTRRRDQPEGREQAVAFEPYNVNYLTLGTALLWFGWAGFNGGSALGGNLRAVSAWTSTHVAACSGGVMGICLAWLRKVRRWYNNRKRVRQQAALDAADSDSSEDPESQVPQTAADTPEIVLPAPPAPTAEEINERLALEKQDLFLNMTVLYFCDGAIAGLVAITPGSGYVPVWSASIFGLLSALFVSWLKNAMEDLLKDDPLQIFAVHAGGGLIGMFLTGLFARDTTVGLDGHSKMPMPQYTLGQRVGWQLVDALAGIVYTFGTTIFILYCMKIAVLAFYRLTGRKTGWWDITGFSDTFALHDRLEPTSQQEPRRAATGAGENAVMMEMAVVPPVLEGQSNPSTSAAAFHDGHLATTTSTEIHASPKEEATQQT